MKLAKEKEAIGQKFRIVPTHDKLWEETYGDKETEMDQRIIDGLEKAKDATVAAITNLVTVARKSKKFNGRDQGAITLLHEAQMSAESAGTLLRSCEMLRDAIVAAHRRLGAPGDFGYGTKEGDALRSLYDACNSLGAAMKAMKETADVRR